MSDTKRRQGYGELLLQHRAKPRRSVTLYRTAEHGPGSAAAHQRYAELFGLPMHHYCVIEACPGRADPRPLRERIADGSLTVSIDPFAASPTPNLVTWRRGETLVVARRDPGSSPIGKVLVHTWCLAFFMGVAWALSLQLPVYVRPLVALAGAALYWPHRLARSNRGGPTASGLVSRRSIVRHCARLSQTAGPRGPGGVS